MVLTEMVLEKKLGYLYSCKKN